MAAVPFAGGLSELPWIEAQQVAANDLHGDVINLCRVIADVDSSEQLMDLLNGPDILVHPECLKRAREWLTSGNPIERAAGYYIQSWMTRSASAGTRSEGSGGVAVRYSATGGSSAVRWLSAVDSLPQWHDHFKRCVFTALDFRAFLANVSDVRGNAVYADPPWVDAGASYKHSFSLTDHHDLASALYRYQNAQVVVRHADCKLYRHLYPESEWLWTDVSSRSQSGSEVREVLISREPPR